MKLWLAVTADEYELPLMVCDSQKELADAYGVSVGYIKSEVCRGSSGRRTGRRFIRVDIEARSTRSTPDEEM